LRRVRTTLCLIVLCVFPAVHHAQPGSASPVAPLPDKPDQFLALVSKINGLASENLRPWHVKASFQMLDGAGTPRETGSFEAFWSTPLKFKMVYTSPSYNRTIWSNESGSFATSEPRWPEDVEWMIRRSLFDVVPEPRGERKTADLRWRDGSTGVKLKCIDFFPIYAHRLPNEVPFYCFDPSVPVIRFSSEVGRFYQAKFDNIISAHGIYIARDVELLHDGVPYFRLHLDTLEALPASGEDVFRADPASRPVMRRIVVDSDLRDMHNTIQVGIPASIRAHAPATPSIGDREIVVQVLVNKKGKVSDARAIRGDAFRQVGALSAARSWEFKPYVVQGEPVEFYTELEFF
jgi:hypothetical protein